MVTGNERWSTSSAMAWSCGRRWPTSGSPNTIECLATTTDATLPAGRYPPPPVGLPQCAAGQPPASAVPRSLTSSICPTPSPGTVSSSTR